MARGAFGTRRAGRGGGVLRKLRYSFRTMRVDDAYRATIPRAAGVVEAGHSWDAYLTFWKWKFCQKYPISMPIREGKPCRNDMVRTGLRTCAQADRGHLAGGRASRRHASPIPPRQDPAPQHPQGVPRSAAPARRVLRTGTRAGAICVSDAGSWVGGRARRSCADLAAFARTASGPGLTCGPGRFRAGPTWPGSCQAARTQTVSAGRRDRPWDPAGRRLCRRGAPRPDTGEGGDRVRFGLGCFGGRRTADLFQRRGRQGRRERQRRTSGERLQQRLGRSRRPRRTRR